MKVEKMNDPECVLRARARVCMCVSAYVCVRNRDHVGQGVCNQ